MKKTITFIALALSFTSLKSQTSTVTVSFETFTLSPNTAYSNTNSVAFSTASVSFQYQWHTSFNYWSGGFSYTNKYDSAAIVTSTPGLCGVKPFKGYNNSNTYVIAQDKSIINLSAPSTTVDGFYITNSTYAYKAIRHGDAFARKFGDTTGTGSGTTIAQGSYPDFFKVTVKGYKNGSLKTDSVPFFLADYRFANNVQDFVISNWQWVNTTTLGDVDSLKFYIYTSDNGSFGPNTPLFFGMDNFTIKYSTTGINELSAINNTKLYPNPTNNDLNIDNSANTEIHFQLMNINGTIIKEEKTNSSVKWDLSELPKGIYLVKLSDEKNSVVKKLVKQ
ncbi:MAG: DUF4465 domain-containing protein [Bacteroidota bacterium]|nr:DUF4465 domain-containing protein [Bacteroidota bacterium]